MSESERGARRRADYDTVEAQLRGLLAARRRGHLGDLDPRHLPVRFDALTPAAVAVLLERVPGYNIVLTKRTRLVEHHKGEISLAGGARDPEDADAVATALRETHEEIGVEPARVSVLGALDDLVTVTGFRVTPVVCAVDGGLEYRPQESEVERILRVPMRVLRAPDAWFEDVRTWRGKTYHLRSCRYGKDVVWGATSRILQHLLDVVPPDVL